MLQDLYYKFNPKPQPHLPYFMKLLTLFLLLSLDAVAQKPPPCTTIPEASQFDFWTGNWKLSWNDSVRGSNTIDKILSGCTVHEKFNDPARNFRGESWSVFNTRTRQWQQTWVDNHGGYITLAGGMAGKEMILYTAPVPTPDGMQIFRMRFYNISQRSFDWSWDSSTDEKKTWKPAWAIHYQRL